MGKCRGTIQDCLNCKKPDCDYDCSGEHRKQKYGDEQKARMKRIRGERRAAGLCSSCGKRPTAPGHKMCAFCQAKAREYKNQESRRKGIKPLAALDGITLCAKCGKFPPKEGFRVCERCYESNLRNLGKTPTHRGIRQQEDGFRIGVDAFWKSLRSQKPE